MMQTPTVVVIGDHTQGLGIARSAGLAGADVWILNDRFVSLTRCSRHVTRYKRLNWGTLDHLERPGNAEYLRDSLMKLPFQGSAVLFGVNEDITRFFHEHREILRARYVLPEGRLDTVYDKFRFNDILPESLRIGTGLCSETNLDALAGPERFLLKGRCGNAFRRITGYKALRLNRFTSSDRRTLFERLAPDQVLIQRVITTDRPVVSVCTFSVKGDIKAVFGYEKLRQYPDAFGTGSYLRSVPVEALLPFAEVILKRVGLTGVSEIEFIHDRESGTCRVIEMNPRAWKSVHFATQCGANLIAQYLHYVGGEATNSRDGYASGQHWVEIGTDLLRMFREKRIEGYERGTFECVFDRRDPLPAVALWTLFPLIALENRLATVASRSFVVPHGSRHNKKTAQNGQFPGVL